MLMRVEHRMSKGHEHRRGLHCAKEIDDMIPSVNGFPGESFSGAPLAEFL